MGILSLRASGLSQGIQLLFRHAIGLDEGPFSRIWVSYGDILCLTEDSKGTYDSAGDYGFVACCPMRLAALHAWGRMVTRLVFLSVPMTITAIFPDPRRVLQ